VTLLQRSPKESVSDRAARPSAPTLLGARRLFTSETIGLSCAVVVVAFLALVPILYLLEGTFVKDGSFTLDFFRRAYSANRLIEMLWNSVLYSAGTMLVALVIGTALAYLVARTDVPMKSLVYAAALVPLIIPGVLHTIGWIFLASPQIGAINKLLEPVLGEGFFNIFSMRGMIFVEGIHTAPLVFLLMFAAFTNMDSSLEESALMSGASMTKVLFRITLPLVKPALALSALIMFIRALSSFEVPALLGQSAGIWVFTSRIYNSLTGFPVDYGTAGAYSTGLLVILAAFTWWQTRLNKRSSSYETISGKGFRPTLVRLRGYRGLAGAGVVAYFVITSLLPMFVLLYSSLLGFYTPPSAAAFRSMSFNNYAQLFDNSITVTAFKNSLILAVSSATIVMALTSLVAWIVVRARVRGASLLNGLSMVPIGVPGLILGVSLLFFYLRVPAPIYGTMWILLIAYVTVFMPYGITYASSAMYQVSSELEESAKICGAAWWTTFRKVTLPLLMPGLIAGWTFVVLVAVRELGASLLLYTPGREVLSILIWQEWGDGKLVQLSALGVVMILMLLVLVLIARKLGAKVGVQTS
jgi:iron(III) transport system permease protein